MEKFELPVSLRIRGKLEDVYAAWVDPDIAKNWLCEEMEGEWAPGKTVSWRFGEHRQEISVDAVEAEKRIAFRWRAYFGKEEETHVTVEFLANPADVSIRIRVAQWDLTKENVAVALDAACGWENLLCRLKVWIEAGVNLQ